MTIREIITTLTPYKKIIGIVILCVIGLLAIWFIFDWFSGYLERREIEQDKKAVNSLMNDANGIKGNLANLAINEAILETEVNVARNQHLNSMLQTNEARERTNQSLLNVNAVQSANFANTALKDALNAQCKYNPARCQ